MRLSPSVMPAILTASVLAQVASQPKAQIQDEEFARSVREWATGKEFISPIVDHLPKATGVPSPKDVLGYHVGAPKKLTRVKDISRYYRALAAASRRVKILPAGLTDEGRECLVIAVSEEGTIQRLDTYKDMLARLADPRSLEEEEARRLINQAKPIYMFMAGLHSAETGPPEMLMELAYRLAVEDSPVFDQIRRNVIVMLAAVAEPDGRDRYVDWYYLHKVLEEKEEDRLAGPPYWGKYIYHDNNRDINYSQVTMRNWLRFYMEWHPPILHDLHESQPFLYTFSGQAPQNPALDPILYGELPLFANFEMTKMMSYGMPGVWTHAFVDMWSPGYLAFMASNHNGMIRMYETFGNGGANTMKRKVDVPQDEGPPPTSASGPASRQWFRPSPPYKDVVWSMRNNTNYMETAAVSALEMAASFSRTVLENFYRKSRNAIESGATTPPFGYVIPSGQNDMTRVAFIVNVLRLQGIEVGRALEDVKVKEGTFPVGSFVVKLNQPYGRLARILLEKQHFPDTNLRTYDDTGWTMGLMNHARVEEVADKAVLNISVKSVDVLNIGGGIQGEGKLLAVLHNGANALITLRYRLKELQFEATEQQFTFETTTIPPGSLLVQSSPRVQMEIRNLGLQAVALTEPPKVAKHLVDLPRLAVFSSWGTTQDVGWVRYAFDHFEVRYDLIYKERVRKGNLRDSYDVIIVPSQGRTAKSLVFDVMSKGRPLAYLKSPEYPSLGMYGQSEDISGGMGLEGARQFEEFLSAGGLLITLGSASSFPTEFGLTRTVDSVQPSSQFYAPGPIVEAEILKPAHPIFYGYSQKRIPVRYANGPLLRVPQEEKQNWVLMNFPGTEKSVLSGLMKGVAETRGRPAIVDVPVGQGHTILFATNPCYRWQNLGEFNLLFNSILHFNDLPKPVADSAAR